MHAVKCGWGSAKGRATQYSKLAVKVISKSKPGQKDMEPRPVITYFGDQDLIGANLQKKLQARLRAFQLSTPKEDSFAFSSICNGVSFVELRTASATCSIFKRPLLHTFWTSTLYTDDYRQRERPLIDHWLTELDKLGGAAGRLIIYCITPEVRNTKKGINSLKHNVDDRMRTDFKEKIDDFIVLRLASHDESRVLESIQAFTTKVNSLCLLQMESLVEKEKAVVKALRHSSTKDFYQFFVQRLNLAVAFEMFLRNQEAHDLYSELENDFDATLTRFCEPSSSSSSSSSGSAHKKEGAHLPKWLRKLQHNPCTTWDYPKLVWAQLSWKYLPSIQDGTSPLLHIWTFLFVRSSRLLFAMGKGWSVSEYCIKILHTVARETRSSLLSLPAGVFDSWAYMSCMEAVLAIMTQISVDSLVSATSSLLLVRAELWDYALQKLHALGLLCGLMPQENELNYDSVVVTNILSGISPIPFEVDDKQPMEDQGKVLINILKSRKEFKTSYLGLGEMVIGAYKHAGRRRMAFRVGTMMAQFDRDLGLVIEAEQLLCDICSFYTEDKWFQLSTKAYSLLADCQKKLGYEDKHVNTILLLASFPPYPEASHDPTQWMSKLMSIAHKSPYQKILTWSPILELVSVKGADGKSTYTTEEPVCVELVLRYNGPVEMKPIIAAVTLEMINPSAAPPTPSSPTSPSPSDSPKPFRSSPFPLVSGNLEELELDGENSSSLHSRPIGTIPKYHRASTTSTLSNVPPPPPEAQRGEGRGKVSALVMGVALRPGKNSIKLSTPIPEPGLYVPSKISLKCGSLDFLLNTRQPAAATESSSTCCKAITVVPSRTSINVSLTPEMGVLLAGYRTECKLSFETGDETVIPEGSSVRVMLNRDVQCNFSDHEVSAVDGTEDRQELFLRLPAISPGSEFPLSLSLLFPPLNLCPPVKDEGTCWYSWNYQFHVYCDWLNPAHVAQLSLIVYSPLYIQHKEHVAGNLNAFLQVMVQNTCPIPLKLSEPTLETDLEVLSLHNGSPTVMDLRQICSYLWQKKAKKNEVCRVHSADCLFSIKFSPEIPGKEASYQEFLYTFPLSNMQAAYELQVNVTPQNCKESGSAAIVCRAPALVVFRLKCVLDQAPPGSSTEILRYKVKVDESSWQLHEESREGTISAPSSGKVVAISAKITPKSSGTLPVPTISLLRCCNKEDSNSVNISDIRTDYVPLTGAQVYVPSQGTVNVITTQSGV